MKEAEHDKCKDIANSTHWKVPKETLDAITDKKTTTQREVPNRQRH